MKGSRPILLVDDDQVDVIAKSSIGDGPEMRVLRQGRPEASPDVARQSAEFVAPGLRQRDHQIVAQPILPAQVRPHHSRQGGAERGGAVRWQQGAAPPERRQGECLERPPQPLEEWPPGVPSSDSLAP